MRRYPLYIFDLDGTLVRGSEAIPNAVEAVDELRSDGAMIRFLTNNSTLSPYDQANRLQLAGFEASEDEVLTSSTATASYCVTNGISNVFAVGDNGLHKALAIAGIGIENGDQAVVVGLCRSFTYQMLDRALQFITRGASFIATNTDKTYPIEHGIEQPGAGAIVAAIRECTGVEPFVIGKPNTLMVDMLLAETGVGAADTCMVGDRFETDIICSQNAGCAPVLILTGVTLSPPPDVVAIQSLKELL